MRLPLKIYSNKHFWVLKNRIEKGKFIFNRQTFRAKRLLSEEKYNAGLTITHIRLSLWSVFKAVAFVSLLFTIEYFSNKYWESNFRFMPAWLIRIQHLMPKPTYPDDRDAIIELISVIASITGVILALFYPILATIASTAYAKVHSSIRNLLLYEKETQSYLRRLTYLTACSITVLLFLSFHFLPGNLILSFLAFYAFTTLFGILKIGLGVYNFFEPSTLSGIVYRKLTSIINDVTTDGEYWNERNFQNHNYKLAFEQTENLALLTSLCLKDNELKETSFKSIFQTSLYSLQFYLTRKSKIPSESLWFPNSYHHRSYFEGEMSLRELSKTTNTFIQAASKQDKFWFEERIISNLSYSLESIVNTGHLNVLAETISMTHPIFYSFGSSIDFKNGEDLLNKLLKNLFLIGKNETVVNYKYEDWKSELRCVETYCYAILKFQVGILDTATAFNDVKATTEYNKINWSKKKSIYSTDIISELDELLDQIFNNVQNEIIVEGKRITPDWYFLQLITAEYLIIIKDKIYAALVLFDTFLLSLVKHFEEQKNPLLSTFASQIGLEIIHKIQYRIRFLKQTMTDIDKLEVCKEEFKWVKPDFEELDNLLSKYQVQSLGIISQNLEVLSKLKWNNQYPDVFAHSYSLVSDNLNESLKTKNLQSFIEKFPPFLKSSLNAFSTLNHTFKHFDKPQDISYQTLLDAMEISGYGYIYSVIYQKQELWENVKSAWDKSFSPTEENIKLLVSYYSYYRNNLYSTGINYIEKHQREIAFSEVCEQMQLHPRNIDNILVKPFINDSSFSSNYYSVVELFIEIYLFTFIDSKAAINQFERNLFQHLCWDIENPNQNYYDHY